MKPIDLNNIEVMIFSRQRQPLMIVEDVQEIRFYDKTDYGNGDTYGVKEWYQINAEQEELPTGKVSLIEYIMIRATHDINFLKKHKKLLENYERINTTYIES